MQFIIKAYDGTDEGALARRMQARPAHLENIQKVKANGRVVCAGGLLDDNGKMIGSFLVMEFENRQMLDAYLETEPYVCCNVWQNITVERCNAVIMNDELVNK